MLAFKDKKYRVVREWSNSKLRKFAPLFEGSVVNVSAWKDLDKEGSTYKSYFSSCEDYYTTNHPSMGKGLQGNAREFGLDLEEPLEAKLKEKFDVVFNHTTLEHVFKVKEAFSNLCNMTKDVAIIVVPFLQQAHGDGFGDFWRFTPSCVRRLFEENGLNVVHLDYNETKKTSVYVFAIASKNPKRWERKISEIPDLTEDIRSKKVREKSVWLDPYGTRIGSLSIINSIWFRLKTKILTLFDKVHNY